MLDLKVKLRQKSVSPSDSDGAVLTGGTSRHPSWWELQFQANEGEQCWGEIAGRRESEYEVVVLTDLQQQQRTRRNEVRNWCQLDTWGHGTACDKGGLVIDLREKSIYLTAWPLYLSTVKQENSVLTTNLCSLLVCNLWTVPLSLRIVVNVVKI